MAQTPDLIAAHAHTHAHRKDRLAQFMELRAAPLTPKDLKLTQSPQLARFISSLATGRAPTEALTPPAPYYWSDTVQAFHHRRSQPGEPGVPGQSNWTPIGPSVGRKGQAGGKPGVSGRVARIAVAPGGSRIYAATALGGVWRSDDGGATWSVNEDGFDIDPVSFASTSLCCGAIAIDQTNPDRVYVGTGEGDVNDIFANRFLSYLPSYRGVGPVRSDDGGNSWHLEPVAMGSAALAGQAFYQLAVDPGDGDNVVGATGVGLYHREPDGMGGYQWVQKRTGVHSDVVVARAGGQTTFFAAAWGDQVYSSPDGSTWTAVGTGFPAGCTRISLAVRQSDPGVLYAVVCDVSFDLLGLYRLDGAAGAWKSISGAPASGLGGATYLDGQGDYTSPVTVDPNNANIIYLGGGSYAYGGDYSGTVFRCSVAPSGAAYAITPTYIGGLVHGDVHSLIHTPGVSDSLWLGCDGGVFMAPDATTAATFNQRNDGLATLAMNYFSEHPTQPAVIFCGAQDNGTLRYTGEEAWRLVMEADGGYCVVNWNDPYQVIVFQNGNLWLTTDGGTSFNVVTPAGYNWGSGVMAAPIGGAPQSGTPSDAKVVCLGADAPYLSTDFGASWATIPSGGPSDTLPSKIFSLAFASASRLYVGTTGGQVYRYDQGGGGWTRTRIDNAAGGALPLSGIITKIAVDVADASGSSIYITFGGSGDYRHVWHFDGTAWTARSGTAAGATDALLDVETNAITVDPANPSTIFVGADIGVWRSDDSGSTWHVFSDGLPDAAVLDLKAHNTARLLRASTHGRSLFEIKLDPPASLDTEIYIRDTDLDVGRASTVDFLPDPEQQGATVVHWESPNIKVDVPTPLGYQTPTTSIDFFTFNDVINDGSGGVATLDPANGTVWNRVYVEVHNRGITPAGTVQVTLLLCDASPHLPALPVGYDANIRAGMPVGAPFTTVGVKTVSNLKTGIPAVLEFPLPSTMLPPPASLPGDSHYCLLALLHSSQDSFVSGITDVDLLTINERKVAQKNLHIVAFVGTPPPPAPHRWTAFQLNGEVDQLVTSDLVLDLRGHESPVSLLLPHDIRLRADLPDSIKGFKIDNTTKAHHEIEEWRERQQRELRHLAKLGRYSHTKVRAMAEALENAKGRPLLRANSGGIAEVVGLQVQPSRSSTGFLVVTAPKAAKPGYVSRFRLMQRRTGLAAPLGGCTYSVQVLRP